MPGRPSLLPPEILPLIGDAFVRSCDLFEEYVFRLTLDVFRRAELRAALAAPASTGEVIARAGLDAKVAPVPLDWILRELASRGVLTAAADDGIVRYRLAGVVPELDAASILEEQRLHDPAALPSYAIAAVAAEHYPAVLRGETTGEKVLFGPERIGTWSDYFSNGHVLYAISNTIGAIACESAFPAEGGAILELGGGLGSAATALLSRLQASGRAASVASYRFTEISIPFLRRGQKTLPAAFPGVPFAFARCDMNRPFSEANVAPGSYALVHGVNTLHVASDLAFTLGEIRTALRPSGALVVSECVRPFPRQPIYVEFIFNLLEAFREPVLDPAWRPNGGFLTPEQWTAALTANGFRDVRMVPDLVAIREVYPAFVVASIVASPA
jgi:SAM-dependent methyltransferase